MEIANNIGLSVKSDNNLKTVKNIVKSLENNKLIKTSKRYVTEVSPNGNEVVKCYKFFKVNDYDEWLLENKKKQKTLFTFIYLSFSIYIYLFITGLLSC